MTRRIPLERIRELKELRRIATMENASFGMPGDHVIHHAWGPDAVPGGEKKDTTEFIADRTRLWRQSWLIGPLDDLIAWAEGQPGH